MWIMNSNYQKPDEFWPKLAEDLSALVSGEENAIANLANISSWLFHTLPELNWCGFYLWSEADQELILGPFQGKPACIRIRSGRGVCGTAFRDQKTLRVDDVSAFPGHIACDSESQSELVIPLQRFGVLDLDSPNLNRFSNRDEVELTRIMNQLLPLLKF
jgi:GAF domain-containing protein